LLGLSVLFSLLKAIAKFFQIRPSQAKDDQRKSKKKALINFDSLVRIEPFQRVTATPWGEKFFSGSLPVLWPSHEASASSGGVVKGTTVSAFRQGKVDRSEGGLFFTIPRRVRSADRWEGVGRCGRSEPPKAFRAGGSTDTVDHGVVLPDRTPIPGKSAQLVAYGLLKAGAPARRAGE
jgi:hypothetical protein